MMYILFSGFLSAVWLDLRLSLSSEQGLAWWHGPEWAPQASCVAIVSGDDPVGWAHVGCDLHRHGLPPTLVVHQLLA